MYIINYIKLNACYFIRIINFRNYLISNYSLYVYNSIYYDIISIIYIYVKT